MHGIIFHELEKYVEHRLGPGHWRLLTSRAGVETQGFNVFGSYPDAVALQLLDTASQMTGHPVPAILEDFGRFIAPGLLKFTALRPGWKTLDVLEHTEKAIHDVVRSAGGEPPRLQVRRVAPDVAELEYRSSRKMCPLAMGIIAGLAEHFDEDVSTAEPSCMLRGAPACQVTVRVRAKDR